MNLRFSDSFGPAENFAGIDNFVVVGNSAEADMVADLHNFAGTGTAAALSN